jgi:Flp pilus assembly protein TadG
MAQEGGAIAVVVALLAIPMMILAAFTVDLGNAYSQAMAFSAGADSAALAIVNTKRNTINAAPTAPTNCRTIVNNDNGQALAIAKTMVDANGQYGMTATGGNISVTVTLACLDASGAPSDTGMLKATVNVSRAVPTTLGQMVGVPSVTAGRSGSAALGVAGKVNGVFPMAVCDMQAQAFADDANTDAANGVQNRTETIASAKVWNAACTPPHAGSGNWGWLACNNGVDARGIGESISQGCGSNLTLSGTPPQTLADGAPGNKINSNNIRGPLSAVIGEVFAFPVYNAISGNGAGTQYTITGFIQLKLLGYTNNGDFSVQFVSYSPGGTVNNLCGTGGLQCTMYNAWSMGLRR